MNLANRSKWGMDLPKTENSPDPTRFELLLPEDSDKSANRNDFIVFTMCLSKIDIPVLTNAF